MDTADDASFAYQAVYRYLVELIEASPSTAERKLPSLRQLAQRLGVSVSTTKYAYALLEDEGRVQARPKLGYFTRAVPALFAREGSPDLLDRVFAHARQPGMLALSSDAPAMLLSLENPLLMMERELARQYPRSLTPLYLPFGEPELRAALAARYTQSTHNYWQADRCISARTCTACWTCRSALWGCAARWRWWNRRVPGRCCVNCRRRISA